MDNKITNLITLKLLTHQHRFHQETNAQSLLLLQQVLKITKLLYQKDPLQNLANFDKIVISFSDKGKRIIITDTHSTTIEWCLFWKKTTYKRVINCVKLTQVIAFPTAKFLVVLHLHVSQYLSFLAPRRYGTRSFLMWEPSTSQSLNAWRVQKYLGPVSIPLKRELLRC